MMRALFGAGLLLVAPAALAQGALSTQGFGYPVGGLSTRAIASGGGSGELDPRSARNPATGLLWQRPGLYVQYDPEMRRVHRGAFTDNTTTPRFGVAMLAFNAKRSGIITISTHSFLDRTWTTNVRSGQRLGPDSIAFSERVSSSGGVNDSRIAYAWGNSAIALGVGLHLYSGENRIALRRVFDDSLRYRTLNTLGNLSYSGTGLSAGLMVQPHRTLILGASGRYGGGMRLHFEDTLATKAKVPSRFGLSARWDPAGGVSILAGADRTIWSRMDGLGSASSNARDGWDYGLGAEFTGQRTRNTSWIYSVGVRARDLPFSAGGASVSEKTINAGLGIPIGGQRSVIDVAILRAFRDAAGTTTERAWLVSMGLTVRP